MTEKVRLGILGLRRGRSFVESAKALGEWAEVASLCDHDPKAVKATGELAPLAGTHDSYEAMLEDDIDAVVLCNYFPDHAPAAVKAMEAGKDVLSEVSACLTLADGVKLARTVERTNRIYMMAENYCYMAPTQAMRALYAGGSLGEFRYGEGEYVHFSRDIMHRLVDVDRDHWRLWLPATYYCTHSLGPILRITGLRPVKVSGAAVPGTKEGWTDGWRSDYGMEIVRLQNGAIVKSLHGGGCPREPWSPWYVLYGTKGVVENRRWPDYNQITVYTDGDEEPKTYRAEFSQLKDLAGGSGHGGGDLFVMFEFLKSVRTNSTPDIDVYMALDMTLPGILAWRSALNGGGFIDVPDMREETIRRKYEDDSLSPRPGTPEDQALPNTMEGSRKPPEAYMSELRRRQIKEPY